MTYKQGIYIAHTCVKRLEDEDVIRIPNTGGTLARIPVNGCDENALVLHRGIGSTSIERYRDQLAPIVARFAEACAEFHDSDMWAISGGTTMFGDEVHFNTEYLTA